MREISIIKERILKYLDFKGVSKYKFYQETGITNGILSQPNGISEENLLKFLTYYKDISAEWLLTGEEPMLKGAEAVTEAAPPSPPVQAEGNPMAEALLAQLAEKDRQIAQLLAIISNK